MRTTHRPITTIALASSLFMAALEMTVVSTAMPTVVSELGGIQSYSWVFTAYMLTSTITVPIYGKLADLYGRKPILLFGIALFMAGSMASGLSGSMNQLIVFRALQGLGAGAIQPMALTIVGDLFSLEQRARLQGLFSGVWGVAGLIGPLTGGLIVKYLSWHWIFFVNVPVGLLAAALLMGFFFEQVEKKPHMLDFGGAALLTAGVVALLFGIQGTGRSLLALPAAGVILIAFVLVERRAAEPVIPLRMFALPVISISSAAGALFSAAMFGITIYVPLYVQGVLGGTATQAGGMITPLVVCWPIASTLSGRLLTKVGYRPLIVGGLGLAALSTVATAVLLKPGVPLIIPEGVMALFGVGLGLASTALIIAVQTSVGWELRGVATASIGFFRTIGGTLGVGLMGAVLVAQLSRDPSVPMSTANALLGPEHGRSLAPEVLRTLSGALSAGLSFNFWITSAAMIAAFAAGLLFPRVTPRRTDSPQPATRRRRTEGSMP